ncbi:von Willebrand factor isoform X1 [Strongylocentrotus purpuratus]|uniref:CTCK domain-containing protein n=1 Tax=Strongylocentrotus purpuratus TaxID=7668 RepID=A0A7M7P6F8_STRPU|nr:von Willebrand factor isoform X1 [Strongylocentrotus purpuratus]
MTCDEMSGIVAQQKACNVECDQGSLIHIPDQCCPECVPTKKPGCEVTYSNKTLEFERFGSSCRSTSPVLLGECSGGCVSSVDSNQQSDCECCQVIQTTQITVPFRCANGSLGSKNENSITQCLCMKCPQ